MLNQQASSRRPSFFKFMMGDFKNTIRIPVEFTGRLEAKASPTKYTIRDPTGISWDVTVKKIKQNLCFTTGWPSFVKRNSLDLGDLLVFTYLGTFNFEVKIFGPNWCKKHIQPHAQNATDQEVVPRKSIRRGEIFCVDDCQGFSPAEFCQVSQKNEKEYDSGKILEAFQGKTRVALNDEINNDHGDQKTNKRSRRIMDQQVSVKRRKSCWENGSRVEEKICETHLKSPSPIPGQISVRKSKRLVKQEKKGKTIEISRRKKSNQGDVISNETEGLSVLSNSERSDDLGGAEVISVHSSDSESEDTGVHCNSREHVNSTEEVECHGLGVEYRNGEVLVHQDGLDSPIQNESSGFTSVIRSENPSCKIVLSRSYLSRRFMHCPRKLVRCFTKKHTGKFNLRLHVANGKIWHVGLNCTKKLGCTKKKAFLCRGWAEFVEKNNLREGDVCFMELIERGKLDLKVSIYRKASATPAKCNAHAILPVL